MKFEQYRPSNKEIAHAKSLMTDEQRTLSEEREREDLESRFLGTLKSGERVFDRKDSHLHDAPLLMRHLPEAFRNIEAENKDLITVKYDAGEIIGTTKCVGTLPGDEIVFAQRPGRSGLTRFVKNKEPVPTSHITAILKRIREGYITLTAYTGTPAEVEPWDPRATNASHTFWNQHALIWGTEPVVPGTEQPNP